MPPIEIEYGHSTVTAHTDKKIFFLDNQKHIVKSAKILVVSSQEPNIVIIEKGSFSNKTSENFELNPGETKTAENVFGKPLKIRRY